MNPINFIFLLLEKHVIFEDIANLKGKAMKWWTEIRTTADEQLDGEKPFQLDLKGKVKLFFDKWYAQVGLAILFIIAQREIMDYLNPTYTRDKGED